MIPSELSTWVKPKDADSVTVTVSGPGGGGGGGTVTISTTKSPSMASDIACICADHAHEYSTTQEIPYTCGFTEPDSVAVCLCQWSLGAMMIAPDDPLRDTPEKAERYHRTVQALAERKDRDADAVRRLLGIGA